jgi:hypothetical protein
MANSRETGAALQWRWCDKHTRPVIGDALIGTLSLAADG